jgi:hypothetical protein
MIHALAPTGEYLVPLIGIDPKQVEEECDACKNRFYLLYIEFDGVCFLCRACRKVTLTFRPIRPKSDHEKILVAPHRPHPKLLHSSKSRSTAED